MKKGFIVTLLAAIALTCVDVASAKAPKIRDIPDILVGDAEDNIGTDQNFFVFTNAFRFVNYVEDDDTTLSELIWSFDEGDDQLEPPVSGTQWYKINGKDPVHVGFAAMAAADSPTPTAHQQPATGNDISTGLGEWASFRDIVFSPNPTPPGIEPTDPAKTYHQNGKLVRFFVSDKTNVASRDILVKTVDNAFDSASGGTPFIVAQDDTFTTNVTSPTPGGVVGWVPLFTAGTGVSVADYDSANAALRVTASSVTTARRVQGWETANDSWLPYSQVGTGNFVRAKFYAFRSGQTNMSDFNQIPNMRFRVANRFAVNSMLEVFVHLGNFDPLINEQNRLSQDYRPSSDPLNPSLYRVSLDPIDVPALNSVFSAPYPEGFKRAYEIYCLEPQENGAIELAESIIGTIDMGNLADSKAVQAFIYEPSASDSGSLKVIDSASEVSFKKSTAMDGTTDPTYADAGTQGVTLSTTAVPSNVFGMTIRDFVNTNIPNEFRVRVQPNQMIKVRWHIKSSSTASNMPQIRLRTVTIRFNWAQKMELGGAWAILGGGNRAIASQIMPGVGSLNPDADGSGQFYNLLLHTPIDPEIQASQPNISTLPGPGDTASSRLDVKPGADLCDTLSSTVNAGLETGSITIDRIEVKAFPLASD